MKNTANPIDCRRARVALADMEEHIRVNTNGRFMSRSFRGSSPPTEYYSVRHEAFFQKRPGIDRGQGDRAVARSTVLG